MSETQQVEGKNQVLEALRAGREIHRIIIADSVEQDRTVTEILKLARQSGIPIVHKERKDVRQQASVKTNQGVIAICGEYSYYRIEDILDFARSKNEAPFVIILDGVEDPHNLGAVIRTAETAGVHGVVIPERGSVDVTPGVIKASAGASEHMLVAKEPNLVKAVEILKKQGIWICGAVQDCERSYHTAKLAGPLAIVIGGEDKGIGRLLRERCDFLVKIPMKGRINSLNVSVSAALIMYEKVRQDEFHSRQRKILEKGEFTPLDKV